MSGIAARVATATISPRSPLPLFGYAGGPFHPSDRHGSLEANMIEIRADDRRLLIVSTDTLYGGVLGETIAADLGYRSHEVLVLGSHTHYAPGVDPALNLGPTDDDYVRYATEQCAEAIKSAPWRDDVSASWASRPTENLFTNRRHPTLGIGVNLPVTGRMVAAPNPAGPVDHEVRLVTFFAGGEQLALLWGASCHPVCTPDPLTQSANFPGDVRNILRAAPGTPETILFAQGFSGDVRPYFSTRVPPRHVGALPSYVAGLFRRFRRPSHHENEQFTSRLAEAVLNARASATPASPVRFAHTVVEVQPDGWSRSVRADLLTLNEDISLASFNAEIMSSRVASLARFSAQVMPASCAGSSIGYWPTDRMLSEGGYESCDSRQFFPPLQWDSPSPDSLWDSVLDELANGHAPLDAAPACTDPTTGPWRPSSN